jgi:transcriptional regulator with XRE-family HTH domain
MQALFSNRAYAAPMPERSSVSRLRQLREHTGLSVRELARQIGEHHTNVSYWERTGHLPRSDVLRPIANALGVSVEEVIGEERPRRVPAPGGKLRRLFEATAKLPRSQQQKVVALLEAFVAQHSGKAA